ncbi:AAA ATPase-like protein [Kutzneria buriramensis]|uniref:AAA ATPase-like protein n=1 Tax=Kutzneria buriramensis TaxID=1045776 RepID=A0A3E0HK29_9PSEU|nr:AAA ATPase-like protein [Kutzneria buriramensis]
MLREAAATAEHGRLIAIRGHAGVGKSTLLEAIAQDLPSADMVIRVPLGGAADDRFGVTTVLDAIRDRFEQVGDPHLVRSIGAVTRLMSVRDHTSEWWTARMVVELAALFGGIAQHRRVVLLVDDAHAVREPALVLGAARRPGCLVVAAFRDTGDLAPGVAELVTLADDTVELGPLPDSCVESLVSRIAAAPPDESLLVALHDALGPLFGNPGTTLATVEDLQERGLLTVLHDRLCLRNPGEPIVLPSTHWLPRRVRRLAGEERELVTAVAVLGELTVDDLPLLARVLDAELPDLGRALDRLILEGVLSAGPDGDVRCRCAALAGAIVADSGPEAPDRLHAAIAADLLDRARRGEPIEATVMADHVSGAGSALDADDEVGAWLVTRAEEAERDQPERAVRWYAAALRRLGPGHPEHARVLPVLLRLVVRTGLYDVVYGLFAEPEMLGSPSPTARADLRSVAVMAMLHVGTPLPGRAVRRILGEPLPDMIDGYGALRRLADSRSVGMVLSAADLAAVSGAIAGDRRTCGPALGESRCTDDPAALLDDLIEAISVGDLATVFEVVLGERYRAPTTGVLSAYQRVVRGYARGDWSAALSAARELRLTGSADTLVHGAGRLFAAEICSARGDVRGADEWLTGVTVDDRLAPLRGWVETGLTHQVDGPAEATRRAVFAMRRNRRIDGRIGLERFLLRALEIAACSGERAAAVQLLGEIEELHRRDASHKTMELVFLARGAANHDALYTRVGADLARRRKDQPDLLRACLTVAKFAGEPRSWLYEAYELAKLCDSPLLLDCVRSASRERGVGAPRAHRSRDSLSPHELRMIELIRAGYTNRQIAADIRVREKTVENSLTRLFAKTGCRSRVELAAASLDGRILDAAVPSAGA